VEVMEDGKVESSMLLGVLPATRSFSWLKPMYQFRPNSGGAATTISPWVGPSTTSLLFRLTLLQAGAMSKRREQDQSQQHEDMGCAAGARGGPSPVAASCMDQAVHSSTCSCTADSLSNSCSAHQIL
jgi:hypothetical protein